MSQAVNTVTGIFTGGSQASQNGIPIPQRKPGFVSRTFSSITGFLTNNTENITKASQATGAILQGAAILQQGKEQQRVATFNAQLSDFDAQIARRNAILSANAAKLAASEERKDTRRRVSQARSRYSRAGVVSTEGSPLLVQEDIAFEGELEAQKILFNGQLNVEASQNQARIAEIQAQENRRRATNAVGTSRLVATSAILKGSGLLQ